MYDTLFIGRVHDNTHGSIIKIFPHNYNARDQKEIDIVIVFQGRRVTDQ